MPNPSAGESRDEWIDRCMGDAEAAADWPDQEQRYAVCVSKWEGKKAMETKAIPLELKLNGDGVIEGYGAVFGNIDEGGDIIEPGAFADGLARIRPKMLWQHDMRAPIGVWDDVSEDAHGLRVKGRLASTALGQEARNLISMGAVDGLSIGYQVVNQKYDGNTRRLMKLTAYEVSVVTIPMNSMARVDYVKSIETERECEDALRSMGFSRRQAKAFIAGGWKGVRSLRDAGDEIPDEVLRDAEAVKTQLATLLERIAK